MRIRGCLHLIVLVISDFPLIDVIFAGFKHEINKENLSKDPKITAEKINNISTNKGRKHALVLVSGLTDRSSTLCGVLFMNCIYLVFAKQIMDSEIHVIMYRLSH